MKKILLVFVLAAMAWGCAGLSRDYKLGESAESNMRYDEAIKYYEKAANEYPNETPYRLALIRAKSSASMAHLAKARTLAEEGKKKEAGAEYGVALFYDPRNMTIYNEMKALEAPPAKKEAGAADFIEPRVKLKAPAEKLNLSFRSPISLRSIFDTLSKISSVSFVFDKDFRDMSLAVDLTGKDLEQAVSYLCATSQNFYRVIDERTILVSPDNFQKRLQYELVAIKTFYLSNLNAQDVQNALMQVIKSPNKIPIIQVDKTMNSITIRDTPQVLSLAAKLLRMWDKAKPEVIIGVEIMEISRTRLKQVGLDFSSTSLGFRLTPSETTDSSAWINLNDLKLGKLGSYQISTPQAIVDFLESDARTKFIAQSSIRGVNGEEIKYLVGQKVPIVNSTFTPIFAGGTNAQPITSFTWENIGIELTLKPRVHLEKEVTVEVNVKITALAGSSTIADIPVIATREIKNMLRLKDGETNLLAGLLRNEERKSVSGIFGLKDIPILGQLFSQNQAQIDQTDVVLTLTPHVVRSLSLTAEDAKALWVEPDSLAGLAGAAQGEQEGGVVEQPAGAPPAEPGEGSANAVYVSPASLEVPKDREFRMNVEVAADKDINNMSLNLTFDPAILKLKDVVEGGLTKQLGEKAPFLKVVNSGGCSLGFSSPSLGTGFKGQSVLAVLVFQAVAPGEASVDIASVSAVGVSGQAVAMDRGGAQVVVR